MIGKSGLGCDTDGFSMVPTLLGQGTQKQHDYRYWEFYEGGGKRAILKGDWKLILYNTNSDLNPRAELFSLGRDESEQKNVVGQHPEVVAELRSLMESDHTTADCPHFKWATDY